MIITPTHRTTFKLLYGRAFRAPSAYEAGHSGESYERNSDLRPERARTAELIWQQRVNAGLLFSTSVFQYRMDGLIDLTTDAITDAYIYRNVGSARARGVETGFDARLGSATSAYANYTYQRTLDEHGTRLTNSPAHLAKAGAGLTITPSLRTAVQLRYESSRRTVYDTDTQGFVLADANLVLAPRISGEHLQLMVRVNNVFNTAYATPGGIEHRQPSIRQDGRNLRVSLRYLF
jgi:iron complex outermembrane receptor protein